MGVKEKLAKKLEDLEAQAGINQPAPQQQVGDDPEDNNSAVTTDQVDGNQAAHGATPDSFDLSRSVEVQGETEGSVESDQEKKPRENWKKRFTNLKSYHDSKMGEMSRTISDQFSVISNLQNETEKMYKELQELKKAKPISARDLATEEELKVIGDEGISAIDRLTSRTVEAGLKDTNEQLERIKAQQRYERERTARVHSETASQVFTRKLSNAVPNYATIDKDPRFAAWLQEPDPIDGRSRMSLLKDAERSGQVAVVASYFKEFDMRTATAKQKLDSKVTPVGAHGSPTVQDDTNQQVTDAISMRDIDLFTADVTKGLYRGREKEQKAIQDRIDAAFMAGKIVR